MESKETDPHGKEAHALGSKLDAGKPPIYSLGVAYFPRALEAAATISAFGARKYTPRGWLTVDNGYYRYTDAMVRHLNQEAKGEVLDTDSGYPHSWHVLWNALARVELEMIENENLPKPS